MRLALLLLVLALTSACRKTEPPAAAAGEPAPVVSAVSASAPDTPSTAPGEPTEAELAKLVIEQYEGINDAGGMPVMVSQTGQALVLKTKIFDVKKEKCSPTINSPPGWYSCELMLKWVVGRADQDLSTEAPSDKGERMSVKWDPSGRWVQQ